MDFIFYLLLNAIFILQVLLIIYFVLTFFPLRPGGFMGQIRELLSRIFQPILGFLRRYIPPIGRFDLSGLVLIFGLGFLQQILVVLAQ